MKMNEMEIGKYVKAVGGRVGRSTFKNKIGHQVLNLKVDCFVELMYQKPTQPLNEIFCQESLDMKTYIVCISSLSQRIIFFSDWINSTD